MNPTKIHAATRHKLSIATRLIAQGKTKEEVADVLGITDRALEYWQTNHADLWQQDFSKAVRELTAAARSVQEQRRRATEEMTMEEVAEMLPAPFEPIPLKSNEAPAYSLSGVMEMYERGHPGCTPGHFNQMWMGLRQFEKWAGRTLMLKDLSDDFVLAFLAAYGEGRSPATVNSKREFILSLWRFARKQRLCKRGPRNIPKLKVKLQMPESWTLDEISSILLQARAMPGDIGQLRNPKFSKAFGIKACDWWESLLLTCYDTGSRIGAILKLTPADVDLARGLVLFSAEIQKDSRAKLCKLYPETILACRKIWSADRQLMWPYPASREMLERKIRFILNRAGVAFGRKRGGNFHKFRRTSGSLVEAAGGDGARHLGNSRKIFESHYKDPRVVDTDAPMLLPRPVMEPT